MFSEVQSDDTGIKRYLNDEDESSVKEGSWSRINTLQHYNIKDGTAVFLYLNKDLEQSFKSLGEGKMVTMNHWEHWVEVVRLSSENGHKTQASGWLYLSTD